MNDEKPAPSCPKCGSPMEPGYLLDLGCNGNLVNRWVSGVPRRRWWVFAISTGDQTIREVKGWRCTQCGFLEMYAQGMSK